MRMTFFRFSALVIIALLGVGVAHSESAIEALMMRFYDDPRPERLVGLMENFQSEARSWNAFPPAAGFLSIVFRRHPDWIEKLVPEHPDARAAVAITAALRLAGRDADADVRSRLAAAGADATLQREFAGLPARLEELRVATATHLDLLWGAFFASGDRRYPRMIVDFLASVANRSEATALDVAATTVAIMGGPRDVLSTLRAKYGDDGARQIAYAATAAWALRVNAVKHPAVEAVIAERIGSNSGGFAAKVLSSLRAGARN